MNVAQPQARMWHVLDNDPVHAWTLIFGEHGERGEYMDGYSTQAMRERCEQDYKWVKKFSPNAFLAERADMMSHLYDNEKLWTHVSMVGFAEHYVLDADDNIAKPFDTFQRQQQAQPPEKPIFSGVVLAGWQSMDAGALETKLCAFKEAGVDYIRLECNLGTASEIGGPSQLVDDPRLAAKFGDLAEVARSCQAQELVPLILLQVPWREPGRAASDYFRVAVEAFANAARDARVVSRRVLFETRPPMALSAQEERGLGGTARASLGLATGQEMFEVIERAFDGDAIAGFCVAGGSTKGDLPQAMEDDTQNGVRQGFRQRARRQWGYEACFWEMGAKLMLQPKVGRLWGPTQAERDAAREMFRVNAEDMADDVLGV